MFSCFDCPKLVILEPSSQKSTLNKTFQTPSCNAIAGKRGATRVTEESVFLCKRFGCSSPSTGSFPFPSSSPSSLTLLAWQCGLIHFRHFSSVRPCVQPAVLVVGTHSVNARGTRFTALVGFNHRRTSRLRFLPWCDCSRIFRVFLAFARARVGFLSSEKTYSSRVDRGSQHMRTTVATR